MPENKTQNSAPEINTELDGKAETAKKRRDATPSLWMQCEGCSKLVYKLRVEERLNVCPECNFHFEI